MSSLAVCRVCLAGNIKINCIKNSRLQDVYERLTNSKLTEEGKPDKVCYICHSQLQRCTLFCDKMQKSGDILSEILRNKIEITPETVAALNKGIQTSFYITREFTSYNPNGELKEEPNSDNETELNIDFMNQAIKSEDNFAFPTTLLCSGCLSANLRTCSIKNTSLQGVYEKLTRNKMKSKDGLPECYCYICISQLEVARKFINKARKSENVLTELFYNGVQLSQNIVSIFNRRTKPIYTRSSVQTLSYCPKDEDTVPVKDEGEDEETDFSALFEDTAGSRLNIIKNETTLGQQIKVEVDLYEEVELNDHNSSKKTIISDIDQYGSCDACDFKCNSDIRLKKHLKMHDHNRKYPCSYCSLRYLTKYHLMLHKNRLHKRRYKCRKCKIIFWNSVKYQNHVISHTAKDLYYCENCPKVFSQLKKLRSHCYSVHRRLRHPCDRCNYSSTSYEWLQDHIIRIHAKSPYYICDFCHKKFISKATLRNHLSGHYGHQTYQCHLCPKTFTRNQNLKNHLKLHTGKPFKCEVCEKCYTDTSLLRKHALTHTSRNFLCSICQKGFFRPDILKNHMKIHTAQKIFECDLCDKKFINNTYVKKHMISHSCVKQHTCSICDKDYKTTRSLKYHIKLIHEMNEKSYKCDVCAKKFTRKQYLESHMELHLRKKLFACDMCEKKFRSKIILVLHKRTHTGEKPYECNECGKTFAQRAAVIRHIRAHNKDKPFKCDLCNKSFAEKISLRTHKFTRHDKIEKLICNLCCKVYIDKEKLTNHIKSHKEKPFLCVKCKKSYFKLSNLTQHVKIHPAEFHCAFCDEEFDTKSNLQRHNVREHKALCRYACNVCEIPFEALIGLNAHVRKHSREKQFACEMCFKTYVERRDLIHHMKLIHNKMEWFN